MADLVKTLTNYLVRGSLAAGATTLLLGRVRKQVKTGLSSALVQVAFFGVLLFLIDFVVPKVLPAVTKTERVAERVEEAGVKEVGGIVGGIERGLERFL